MISPLLTGAVAPPPLESNISLWSTGPMKPIVIKSDWREYDVFAMLMPVRIMDLSIRPNVPEWTKRLPAMEGSPK